MLGGDLIRSVTCNQIAGHVGVGAKNTCRHVGLPSSYELISNINGNEWSEREKKENLKFT